LVLRISSPVMALKDLSELGMPEPIVPRVRQALSRPSGMILTAGPTSSGRTSTLYSLLQSLDAEKRNIMTLEDGIEVRMPRVTQGEPNARAGSTLASGLAAIEGQDPDVILVGELGALPTAASAFLCAMTGRLVLSTLLAGSTVETMTRLLDLG